LVGGELLFERRQGVFAVIHIFPDVWFSCVVAVPR